MNIMDRSFRKLHLVASGPMYRDVNNSKNKDISLLGHLLQNDVYSEMNEANFLILPSECYEGFLIVLVEPISHGLPVLTSNLGSLSEIVEDGKTGILFEPGNSENLAQKAKWLFKHPKECRIMGENARKVYLEKYTPEKNCEMLINIYKEAMNKKEN